MRTWKDLNWAQKQKTNFSNSTSPFSFNNKFFISTAISDLRSLSLLQIFISQHILAAIVNIKKLCRENIVHASDNLLQVNIAENGDALENVWCKVYARVTDIESFFAHFAYIFYDASTVSCWLRSRLHETLLGSKLQQKISTATWLFFPLRQHSVQKKERWCNQICINKANDDDDKQTSAVKCLSASAWKQAKKKICVGLKAFFASVMEHWNGAMKKTKRLTRNWATKKQNKSKNLEKSKKFYGHFDRFDLEMFVIASAVEIAVLAFDDFCWWLCENEWNLL